MKLTPSDVVDAILDVAAGFVVGAVLLGFTLGIVFVREALIHYFAQ